MFRINKQAQCLGRILSAINNQQEFLAKQEREEEEDAEDDLDARNMPGQE